VKVLQEVSEIATALADAPDRPLFKGVAENPHAGHTGDTAAVDMGRISGAFRILAALRMACGFPMCMLVEFDGKPIENLYDFTYALRQHQPGDKSR
jgi:hypothetical protein